MIITYKNFTPDIDDALFIAQNATIAGNVKLQKNSSVWFNAVIRADNDYIIIGENSNIQDNCTFHSSKGFPITLGKNVTIGHNAVVHGATIGDNSLIGMNATILNGAKIGKNSIVGAGALVRENAEFKDNALIVGVPARAVGMVDEEGVEKIRENAQHYIYLSQNYSNDK